LAHFSFSLRQYLRYLFLAQNEHGLHSPFAYNFYTTVIRDRTSFAAFEEIEQLRGQLRRSSQLLDITDFGAGSGIDRSRQRTIGSICKHSEKSPKLAQLIYRVVQRLQPACIVDLGTSLGLTTLYQAKAAPQAQLYTFEGCPNTAAVAQENFSALNASNIRLITGNIDHTLPLFLQDCPPINFAFFDANHRYEPTVRYFRQCLSKASEETVFILDDIYWSPEMKKAWEEIKKDPAIGFTMDLFYVGIVFLRKKQPAQHFIFRR
jgi:predicted O-methyltransferase YrrM